MSGKRKMQENEEYAVGSSKITVTKVAEKDDAIINTQNELQLNLAFSAGEFSVKKELESANVVRDQSEFITKKRPRLHGPLSIKKSSVEEEEKPMDDDSEQIVIQVDTFPNGTSAFYKLRRKSKLWKLIHCHNDREGKELYQMAYIYNGRRIRLEETPYELGMKDGDVIDALPNRSGPCLTCIAHFNNIKKDV